MDKAETEKTFGMFFDNLQARLAAGEKYYSIVNSIVSATKEVKKSANADAADIFIEKACAFALSMGRDEKLFEDKDAMIQHLATAGLLDKLPSNPTTENVVAFYKRNQSAMPSLRSSFILQTLSKELYEPRHKPILWPAMMEMEKIIASKGASGSLLNIALFPRKGMTDCVEDAVNYLHSAAVTHARTGRKDDNRALSYMIGLAIDRYEFLPDAQLIDEGVVKWKNMCFVQQNEKPWERVMFFRDEDGVAYAYSHKVEIPSGLSAPIFVSDKIDTATDEYRAQLAKGHKSLAI